MFSSFRIILSIAILLAQLMDNPVNCASIANATTLAPTTTTTTTTTTTPVSHWPATTAVQTTIETTTVESATTDNIGCDEKTLEFINKFGLGGCPVELDPGALSSVLGEPGAWGGALSHLQGFRPYLLFINIGFVIFLTQYLI